MQVSWRSDWWITCPQGWVELILPSEHPLPSESERLSRTTELVNSEQVLWYTCKLSEDFRPTIGTIPSPPWIQYESSDSILNNSHIYLLPEWNPLCRAMAFLRNAVTCYWELGCCIAIHMPHQVWSFCLLWSCPPLTVQPPVEGEQHTTCISMTRC